MNGHAVPVTHAEHTLGKLMKAAHLRRDAGATKSGRVDRRAASGISRTPAD
jgi:hypothetical protein